MIKLWADAEKEEMKLPRKGSGRLGNRPPKREETYQSCGRRSGYTLSKSRKAIKAILLSQK